MHDNQERLDEFKAELAAVRAKSSPPSADRRLLAVSVLVMIVGVIFIVFGYIGASNTAKVYETVTFLISGGILGLAIVIIGAVLFLRASFTSFMKFWLIRMIYENEAQTDRLLAEVDRSRNSDPAP